VLVADAVAVGGLPWDVVVADLLVAAARTGRIVNVKKGQFLSPFEMRFVVDKLEGAQAAEIWQTDRGTTFGYQNLVVDMRAFPIMAGFGHPTIMDATHAVQLPGAAGGSSGGQREYVPVLAKAALAAGADGLFMETHPDPAKAISDGPSQVPLADFPALVESCRKFSEGREIVLVEGAGGWEVPITETYFISDLAKDLGLPVILVAANRLGALNHILLTLAAIKAKGLTCAGIILNQLEDEMDTPMITNKGILAALTDVPVLDHIIHNQDFLSPELMDVLMA
jgi:hypothetical protein